MKTKVCMKCGLEKHLSDFYKHPEMTDGHVNKCKACNKKDVTKNRKDKIEYYREYDRKRGNRQGYEYTKEYRKKNPEKYNAHKAVGNAIRDGKLKKKPCEICGTTKYLVAHHEDYSKPLDVIWLCSAHHKWIHS